MSELTQPTVDPVAIPKEMTPSQVEWFILFSIAVANKPAKATEKKMDAFMGLDSAGTPFERVRSMIDRGELGKNLHKVRFGQYTRIEKAFRYVVNGLDTRNLSVKALESVPGIGPKTARFITLYTLPDIESVPLDTHILKFLRSLGHAAPKSTPPAGKTYARLEQAFINEAHRRGMTVRDLDTMVWNTYANYDANGPKLPA